VFLRQQHELDTGDDNRSAAGGHCPGISTFVRRMWMTSPHVPIVDFLTLLRRHQPLPATSTQLTTFAE